MWWWRAGASEFARLRPQGQLLDDLSMPNDLALGPVDSGRLRVFSGSSNPALAKDIAMSLGMPLGGITIKRFADGEVYVQLQVTNHSPDITLPPALRRKSRSLARRALFQNGRG